MAEALVGVAAVALAGNVLQFCEAGIKLTRQAVRAYKSASGLTEENEILRESGERIKELATSIEEQLSGPEGQQIAEAHRPLHKMAKASSQEATSLIAFVEGLRIPIAGIRGLKTLNVLIWSRLKKTQIESLEARLVSAKSDLILHLTDTTRNQQTLVLSIVNDLKDRGDRLETSLTSRLQELQAGFENIQQSHRNEPHLLRVLDVTQLTQQLNLFAGEVDIVSRRQQILRSLLFQSIKQRHNAIQDHHKATFNWIFTHNDTKFCEWLEIASGIFWVNGKAGSGKSTLMKFLASHPITEAKLRRWSDRRRVIIASHFFWNSGGSMQKSLTGLFQTLLYQILKECPELIDIVCGPRWADPRWAVLSDSALFETWDIAELLAAFEVLSRQSTLPLNFCFFIDGLDEYTAGGIQYTGDFDEIINPLKNLASSKHIKICISSRPWSFFTAAFEDTGRMLQLEQLTKEDIRKYVKAELNGDTLFQKLSRNDIRCREIPDVVVERAQGVFLWVHLVVNSLKRGLGQDDNYADLRQRLDALPMDLRKYFKHMLKSIEPTYWDQTTRIFRVVIAAEQALPLIGFEFLDRESTDPGYTLKMPLQTKSWSELSPVCQRLKTRLNARCRDLLYVADHPREANTLRVQVDFLHRTVRDYFLDTGVINDMIKQRPTQNFNPLQSLCKMMLGLSKIISPLESSDHSQHYNQTFLFADSLMYYSRRIEENALYLNTEADLESTFEVLDELDHANSERYRHIGFHWTNVKDTPKREEFQEYRQKTFLAAATQARLTLYVGGRIRKNPAILREKRGRPLLDYALRPDMITPLTVESTAQGPVVPIIKLLLEHEANPNANIYIYDNKTPWELFLMTCLLTKMAKDQEDAINEIAEAMQLMLLFGASTNRDTRAPNMPLLSVTSIANGLHFSIYQKARIDRLLKANEKKQKWWFSRWISI